MPRIYMITGPNGAGKTTTAMTLLPDLLHCKEYVNADAIAAGLSPFRPENTAFQAGRLMLNRIHQLADDGHDFAFETTGASRSFLPFLLNCKRHGYELVLMFLWLKSPELALARIADRVRKGGHSIPENIVRRRYFKAVNNVINRYCPIMDEWSIYNNSEYFPKLLAEKKVGNNVKICDQNNWLKFLEVVSDEY